MGILLVYDVTDESSFNNIRNWMRNIEQHAADNVNKILVGNKCDMDESKRAVPTSRGQALADEFNIPFFETSAKSNINVVGVRITQYWRTYTASLRMYYWARRKTCSRRLLGRLSSDL
eukprot:scaffold48_cov395-Prasinococcus_capsulatus_cf.AAC.8